LFPLDFDERHNISAIIDYRYDEGKRYNGPRIGRQRHPGKLSVINLQVSCSIRSPVHRYPAPERFGGSGTLGSINGNRLPWRFNVPICGWTNLQFD
jgi:hypothetical protein